LLDAFDRAHNAGATRGGVARTWRLSFAIVVAASLLLAVVTVHRLSSRRSSLPLETVTADRALRGQSPALTPPTPASAGRPRFAAKTFRPKPATSRGDRATLGLPSAAPIVSSAEPNEIARVVRVRIPRASLVALGVPIIDPDAPGTLDVELLVGDDGQ